MKLNQIKTLKHIVKRKNTMPILSSVALSAGTIYATDLDCEYISGHDLKLNKPICLDIDYLKKIKNDIIGACVDDNNVFHYKVDGSAVEFSCSTNNFEEYPSIQTLASNQEKHSKSVDRISLLTSLELMQRAVSNDITRFNIDRVQYISKDKSLVSTDGHRLYLLRDIDFGSFDLAFMRDYLKAIIQLLKNSDASSCMLSAIVNDKGETYRTEVESLTESLTVRTESLSLFPDYKQVIPSDSGNNQIVFNLANLKKFLSEMLPAIDCDSKSLVFESGLAVRSRVVDNEPIIRAQLAKGKEVINTSDNFCNFAINGNYLFDLVKDLIKADCETLTVNWKSNVSPLIFTTEEASNFKAVIMPLRME